MYFFETTHSRLTARCPKADGSDQGEVEVSSPEIARRLCLCSQAVPVIEIHDTEFFRVSAQSSPRKGSAGMGWLVAAIPAITLHKWPTFTKRSGTVLAELRSIIAQARGAPSKFTTRIDANGMASDILTINVRGRDLRVGNSKWPIAIEATTDNLKWLVKNMKSDIANAPAPPPTEDRAQPPGSDEDGASIDADDLETPNKRHKKHNKGSKLPENHQEMLISAIEEHWVPLYILKIIEHLFPNRACPEGFLLSFVKRW